METAAKHIGFSGAHGSALVVLSALKKFGLVEDKGGRLVPSKGAIDILTFQPGHPRRIQALRTAVVSPTAYRSVLEQYGGIGQLPSDQTLRAELVADRGFTEKSVTGFVKDFKASLVYAGLSDGNRLSLSVEEIEGAPEPNGEAGEEMDGSGEKSGSTRSGGAETRRPPPPPAEEVWGGPSMRLDLPRGNVIEIRLRSKVTPQEFQKIKKIYELSELSFVEDEGPLYTPANDPDREQ